MNKYNTDGRRHGVWTNSIKFSNSNKDSYICIYHNGKEIGYEEFDSTSNSIHKLKKIYHIR